MEEKKMTRFNESTTKKLQLYFAGGALLMYLVYMVISLFTGLTDYSVFSDFWYMRLLNRGIMLLPFVVMFVAAIISNKIKRQVRYIPYVLVGMEMLISLLGRLRVVNYHPVGIFEGAGWCSYSTVCMLFYMLIAFAFLVMPFAKKPTLITYSGIVSAFYILAMVLEIYYDVAVYSWGFQIDVVFKFLAYILYQLCFIWFAFEMTTENRVHIYSRIFDFFIGLDFLDDDFSELFEEIKEELDAPEQEYRYTLDEVVADNKTSKEQWSKCFDDLSLKSFDTIELAGSNFLLDPLEDTNVVYHLERGDEHHLTVWGRFTHAFSEEQSARILRKKSVLNRTFADIEIQAVADTDIGVEYIEEGKFNIQLMKRTFDVSQDDYSAVKDYMIHFLETIIVIQNTESIE